MKFGWLALASVGAFAFVPEALAQQQPDPAAPAPDAPAAAPEDAPADPGAAPAEPGAAPAPASKPKASAQPADPADPAAPAPAPAPPPASGPQPAPTGAGVQVSIGAAGVQGPGKGGDEPTPDKKEEAPKQKMVRWRGTGLNWSNTVTTTALGIGRDNIGGEDESYTMGFGAVLNYYVLEEKAYKLRIATAPGFDVELTDGSTTTRREPLLRDLPLSAVLSLPLWKSADEEFSVASIFNGTLILPTSKASRAQGTYLTTSPRALLMASFPILGKDSPALKGAAVGLSGRWDHQFNEATTGVNEDIQRPRQTSSGSTFLSDQLTGRALAPNSVRVGSFVFLSEKVFDRTLWVFVGGGLAHQYASEFEGSDCEVQLQTGCVRADRLEDPNTTRVSTSFSAGLSYFPMVEWGISLDYANAGPQLGPNGERRNVFYGPDAQFSATLNLSVDAIYERMTGPPREEPFILFGSNKKAPKKGPSKPKAGPSLGVF